MKIHLFQLTNQPATEELKAYLILLRELSSDLMVYQNGIAQKEALVPTGNFLGSRLGSLRRPAQMKSLLNAVNPDDLLIITDSLTPVYLPASLPCRTIHLLHQNPPEKERSALQKAYRKTGMEVLCLSHAQSQMLSELFSEETKRHCIYPPFVPLKTNQEKRKESTFIVGCSAPMQTGKGIETVIRALQKLTEVLPQLRLILIGDGPEKGRLQWLVAHLHLKDRVQFVTAAQDYQRFIPHFDVLVLPAEEMTIWDSDLLHALDHGVAIIATKQGIYEELIQNGKNGLLFEAGNSHVLSQHLMNLYNHPDWREYYQKESRTTLALFECHRIKQQLISLFENQ